MLRYCYHPSSGPYHSLTVILFYQGVNPTHNEYVGRVKTLMDFVGDGNNGVDCQGHGTHVAGTIGGVNVGVAKGVHLHSGTRRKQSKAIHSNSIYVT
jgi:subtilisin family serine protease